MSRINLICLMYFSILDNFCDTILHAPWPSIPYRLVDFEAKDLFFDRIVFLTLDVPNFIGDNRAYKHIATGVLLDNQRVLTSYNAMRNLTKSQELLSKIYVCYILNRKVMPPYRTFYDYECATIQCGRPVLPMNDDELSEDQWHGVDKKHSPLHDLMVIGLDDQLNIWVPEKEYTYEERHTPEDIQNQVTQRAGPLLTELAKRHDQLKKQIQFVSLGLTLTRVKRYHGIELAEYEDSDNVVVDCDQWLPRNWGYFFCLANDDNKYGGFASGAMLFSSRKLFGVGSFTMWRGKDSIIVFTDVRHYLQHINHTCTERDLNKNSIESILGGYVAWK